MSSRRQAQKAPESSTLSRRVRPVAVSVLAGTLCCALVLFLMAALMSSRSIPQFAVAPMASFAFAAGGLVGGFFCARLTRENGLMNGAVCGAALTVIVLLAGLALKDNGFGIPALFKIAFVMLSSMIGGVLGVNTRRRSK